MGGKGGHRPTPGLATSVRQSAAESRRARGAHQAGDSVIASFVTWPSSKAATQLQARVSGTAVEPRMLETLQSARYGSRGAWLAQNTSCSNIATLVMSGTVHWDHMETQSYAVKHVSCDRRTDRGRAWNPVPGEALTPRKVAKRTTACLGVFCQTQ